MAEDLMEFLRNRYDEEVARATRALDGPRNAFVSADEDVEPLLFDADGAFVLPARILADIKAKRALIDALERADTRASYPDFEGGVYSGLHDAIEYLALPYADHPDYRDEWRP